MKKALLIILSCIIFTGCSITKTVDANYSAQVDPDYNFDKNKTIVVFAADGLNTLTTKYYVNELVSALKIRGFNNTYSYKDLTDEISKKANIVVVMNVDKKSDTYEYQGADYGMVDTGNVNTQCTGFGNMVNCSSNSQKTFGVTGYSTKTGITTGHFFNMIWQDVGSKSSILEMHTSSFDANCSDDFTYRFLIQQTIERLDLTKPNKYKYSVTLPENTTCEK